MGSLEINRTIPQLTVPDDASSSLNPNQTFARLHQQERDGILFRMDGPACIDAYARTFQSDYSNLLLVMNSTEVTVPLHQYSFVYQQLVYKPSGDFSREPYQWMCAKVPEEKKPCSPDLSSIRSSASKGQWRVPNLTNGSVEYCLSERTLQHCKLQYSLPLAVVVIVFNLIKAVIMCYIAFSTAGSAPLLTIGDAIASFLRTPDRASQGNCLLSREDIEGLSYNVERGLILEGYMHTPHWKRLGFSQRRRRWHSAVSHSRWSFCLMSYVLSAPFLSLLNLFLMMMMMMMTIMTKMENMCSWIIAVIVCVFLLGYGIQTAPDRTGLWKLNLGSTDTQTLISGDSWPSSFISNIIIANIPQLMFSMLHFAFNALLTTMALAAEWSRYALHPKGLRVSRLPQNQQRTSYFISLPYRLGIPLIVTSAILQWLISQSLFLVGIEARNGTHDWDPSENVTTCGYSPLAISIGVLVGVAMLLCLIGLSRQRFASEMPVASSCSLAIAAACHPTYDPNLSREDQELEPLYDMEFASVAWGVVYSGGPIGHCTFSSEKVDMPVKGEVYH